MYPELSPCRPGANDSIRTNLRAEQALPPESPTAMPAQTDCHRTLFEQSPSGLVIVCSGSVVACNKAALDLFRVDSTQDIERLGVEGLSASRQARGETAALAARRRLRACRRSGRVGFTWQCRRGDGTRFAGEVRMSPPVVLSEVPVLIRTY
jgi:PAS domain-containing protein